MKHGHGNKILNHFVSSQAKPSSSGCKTGMEGFNVSLTTAPCFISPSYAVVFVFVRVR